MLVALMPPAVVQVATDEYFEEEDATAQWIRECCQVNRYSAANSSVLFRSWEKWARAAGEFVGSQKRFSQALQARGFSGLRTRTGFEFRGIAPAIDRPHHETEDENA